MEGRGAGLELELEIFAPCRLLPVPVFRGSCWIYFLAFGRSYPLSIILSREVPHLLYVLS